MEYALVVPATVVGFLISVLARNRTFSPVLGAAAVTYPFLLALRQSVVSAFLVLCFWTLIQSAIVILYSTRSSRAERLFWNAGPYSRNMFQWIETGVLPEGSTGSVLAAHLRQAAVFCALALLSANLLSLILGCALLNYMNYYVSRLVVRFDNRAVAVAMGWNPWSVIRVLSFLWLGAALSVPWMHHLGWTGYEFGWWNLLPGLLGLTADIALKTLVSRRWSSLLKARLGNR
jgi:hypothetical protein